MVSDYRVKVGTCTICHREGPIHQHHPDYSKPKKTMAICASCHKKIHLCSVGKQRTTSNPYINPLAKLARINGTEG